MNKEDVLKDIKKLDPNTTYSVEDNTRKELDEELLALHAGLDSPTTDNPEQLPVKVKPDEKLIKVIFLHNCSVQVGRFEIRDFKVGDTYILPENKYKRLKSKYTLSGRVPFKSESAHAMDELRANRKDKRPKEYLDILARKKRLKEV